MPQSRPPSRQAPSTRRGLRLSTVLVGLLASILLLGGAAAQLPTEPDVNLTAQSQSATLQSGDCVTYQVRVENTGAGTEDLPVSVLPPETVTFELTSPPRGWSTSPGTPGDVELERGEGTTVRVGLCADDADSATSARVTLTAILQPASPADEEQRDQVSLSATVEEDELFGIPWDFPPWILWVVLIALGVMLASVVVTRKKSTGGVTLSCDQSNKEVTAGRGTSFPLKIHNESRSKDVVSLTTSPVPHGWDTFLPIVDVPLEAGDEQTVWISVKSPEDAHDGAHVAVKVWARSSASAGEQASLDLTVTVRAPGGETFGGLGAGPTASEEAPRSVYEPEDADAQPPGPRGRSVAFKRRKK